MLYGPQPLTPAPQPSYPIQFSAKNRSLFQIPGCAPAPSAVYISEDGTRKVGLKDQTSTLLDLLDTAGGSLYALLTRLTLSQDVAEDLMQELFIKLSRSRGFARAGNQPAYARRAAMNLAFDWRRAQRRGPTTTALPAEPSAPGTSPLGKLVRDERLAQILDAAAKLGGLSRTAFVLRHVQQESYEVVADHLGKTPHQARALCHKAIEQIRSALNTQPPTRRRKEDPHAPD